MKKILLLLIVCSAIAYATSVEGDYFVNGEYFIKSEGDRSIFFSAGPLIDRAVFGPGPSLMLIGKEEYKVTQDKPGTTYIYSGIPGSLNQPTVYFVEHYVPEKPIEDPARAEGKGRIVAVISGSSALVESSGFSNRGMSVESFEDLKQIDFLGSDLVELTLEEREVTMKRFDYHHDQAYDRGYVSSGEAFLTEVDDTYFTDVFPHDCSMFGLVFYPGQDPSITSSFTKSGGYALGLAYTLPSGEFNDDELDSFVVSAKASGITPVIRVLGERLYHRKAPAEDAAKLIERLNAEGVIYFQIWDKPNVAKDGHAFPEPKDYVDYVQNISVLTENTTAMLISASLDFESTLPTIDREAYLQGMIDAGIVSHIDYWGSTVFGGRDETSCYSAQIYDNLKVCLGKLSTYKWELQKLSDGSGKVLQVFITEAGQQILDKDKILEEMQYYREDSRVKAALFFVAIDDNIYKSASWIENGKLKKQAELVANTCSPVP
ncbi:MAG: hypothetical protein HGA85_05735 [Nanoarchaeota archaeon]|nr:hypothetical protein [Nanoarchaeota archaeon]